MVGSIILYGSTLLMVVMFEKHPEYRAKGDYIMLCIGLFFCGFDVCFELMRRDIFRPFIK